jgi:hypothetical protein
LLVAAGLSALVAARQPASTYKIDAELQEKLSAATNALPVFVLLTAQSDLDETSWRREPMLKKRKWREKVVADLKRMASVEQQALAEEAKAAGHTISVERRFWIVNAIAAKATAADVRWLASSPRVARLYYRYEKPSDLIRKEGRFTQAFEQPNPRPITREEILAPHEQPLSWNLTRIQADLVWSRLGLLGRGVTVAIMDSGVNYRHSDFAHHLWRNADEIARNGKDDDGNGYVDDIYGYNFANDNSNVDDDFFHGTSSAGIICGDGRAGIVTGVAPGADLMILRMYDQMTQHNVRELWRAHQYDAWEAYEYAVVHGADVLNMSFAWEPSELPLHAPWRIASTNVVAAGVALVAGSGNFRGFYELPDQVRPPASVKAVITTGGTLEDDRISPLSSRGPVTWTRHPPFDDFPLPTGLAKPEVSAPFGDFPVIPFRGRGYQVLSGQAGSSLTSPHVAGVVALMLEQFPELRPDEILDRLVRSSRDVGELGTDPYAGAGLVQAYDAIVLDDLPRLQPTTVSLRPQGGSEPAFHPGTSLKLAITLTNTGASGSPARFTLRTATDGVKIDPPEVAIGRLAAKNEVVFSISLGSALPPGSLVPFTLDAAFVGGGRRQFGIELPVYGSDVLLVDDDGGGDYEMAWRQSLERLARAYDFHSMWRYGWATLPDLTRYKTVVWLKGEEFVKTLDDTLEARLRTFVRGGGRLVLSGQNVAADLKGRAVLQELFGTRFVADLGRTAVLRGAAGTPLAGLEARYNGNNLSDAVAAVDSGQVSVTLGQPAGSGLAVATERTWLLTFELNEVIAAEARDRIVAAVLSAGGRSQGLDQ